MITYEEALQSIYGAVPQEMPHHEAPLEQACGHIAAADVTTEIANPPFRNSAMDGFAVIAHETDGASPAQPQHFSVSGMALAGEALTHRDSADSESLACAVEITTGAPVPDRYDAVVRVEDVQVLRSGPNGPEMIALTHPVAPAENVRDAGEDYQAGAILLARGTRITPAHILAVASAGRATIRIHTPLRVGIISTGSEILPPGTIPPTALPPGKIYSSTQAFLHTALDMYRTTPHSYGIVADTPDEFTTMVERALRDDNDVIITTGAVSMGRRDFIPDALRTLGAQTLFHKTAIRPGKPILVATLPRPGKSPVVFFCLPGNPVSSVVGLRFFVVPFLRACMGMPAEETCHARMEQDFRKPKTLKSFMSGHLSVTAEGATVLVPQRQMSFMIQPILQANTWVILPEGTDHIPANEPVECVPLYPVL